MLCDETLKVFQVMSGEGLQGQLKFYTFAARRDDAAAPELTARVSFLDPKKRGDGGINPADANNSQGCGRNDFSLESTESPFQTHARIILHIINLQRLRVASSVQKVKS